MVLSSFFSSFHLDLFTRRGGWLYIIITKYSYSTTRHQEVIQISFHFSNFTGNAQICVMTMYLFGSWKSRAFPSIRSVIRYISAAWKSTTIWFDLISQSTTWFFFVLAWGFEVWQRHIALKHNLLMSAGTNQPEQFRHISGSIPHQMRGSNAIPLIAVLSFCGGLIGSLILPPPDCTMITEGFLIAWLYVFVLKLPAHNSRLKFTFLSAEEQARAFCICSHKCWQ